MLSASGYQSALAWAARKVTITRGSDSAIVNMASAVGKGEDIIMQDATQDDRLVTFASLDFTAPIIVPERYDRVTDTDGRVYAIQRVEPQHGVSGELYGYKCLIRGDE
jgi:hypothetical protein